MRPYVSVGVAFSDLWRRWLCSQQRVLDVVPAEWNALAVAGTGRLTNDRKYCQTSAHNATRRNRHWPDQGECVANQEEKIERNRSDWPQFLLELSLANQRGV